MDRKQHQLYIVKGVCKEAIWTHSTVIGLIIQPMMKLTWKRQCACGIAIIKGYSAQLYTGAYTLWKHEEAFYFQELRLHKYPSNFLSMKKLRRFATETETIETND